MPADKFSIVAKADGVAEITLYDVIDKFYGVSAAAIHEALKAMGDVKEIRVRINSPGGSVFEGTAIYNLLKQHKGRKVVCIDGLAASMASVVAMAGDEIEIGDGAYLMIHDPLGTVKGGDADEMRDMADLLEKMKGQLVGIYSRRTGHSREQISAWMKDETWMTTDEAIHNRFADRKVPSLAIAATANLDVFGRVPDALRRPKVDKESKDMAEENKGPQPATWAELKTWCPGADAEFLGKQMDAQATPDIAARAWMAEQQKRLDAANEAKAKADAAALEAKAEAERARAKPGVEALGGVKKTEAGGDPIAQWKAAVQAKEASGMAKSRAVRAVVQEHPDLHAAYLAAVNS